MVGQLLDVPYNRDLDHDEPEKEPDKQGTGDKKEKNLKGEKKGGQRRGRASVVAEGEDQESVASATPVTAQQIVATWTGSLLRDIGTGRQIILQLGGLEGSSESDTQFGMERALECARASVHGFVCAVCGNAGSGSVVKHFYLHACVQDDQQAQGAR